MARRRVTIGETVQNGVSYVSIQEAMKRVGVSRRTIYNWMDNGRVTFVAGPSGKRWIPAEQIAFKAVTEEVG